MWLKVTNYSSRKACGCFFGIYFYFCSLNTSLTGLCSTLFSVNVASRNGSSCNYRWHKLFQVCGQMSQNSCCFDSLAPPPDRFMYRGKTSFSFISPKSNQIKVQSLSSIMQWTDFIFSSLFLHPALHWSNFIRLIIQQTWRISRRQHI